MTTDDRRHLRQHAAMKLQTRVSNLTHELLSASDYDTALGIATELFDSVQALLEQLRPADVPRLQ